MTVAVDTGLYQRVQQFYAVQMRLLDEGRAEEWAATFTEDGEFGQDRRPEPRRGRAEIGGRLRTAADALAARGVLRRHWLGMLAVDPQPDGTVLTRYYALVIETPQGGPSALHLSTAVDDVLVPDGDAFLVRRRYVVHDGWTP
ncbi:nuclear transport factor 2 family protein [Dactylosporangium sp. NPDC049525]|uniref:nuclear transport factor 2 family protein n=1 Tax=Dactylosporangium sp. NPDC049525 TaxID=3154730 RepID=UPI00341BC9F2